MQLGTNDTRLWSSEIQYGTCSIPGCGLGLRSLGRACEALCDAESWFRPGIDSASFGLLVQGVLTQYMNGQGTSRPIGARVWASFRSRSVQFRGRRLMFKNSISTTSTRFLKSQLPTPSPAETAAGGSEGSERADG